MPRSRESDPATPEAPTPAADEPAVDTPAPASGTEKIAEIGGRGGLDPARYGDWEKNGRCVDF